METEEWQEMSLLKKDKLKITNITPQLTDTSSDHWISINQL